MKKFKLQKVITSSLIVTSVLALSSIGVSAEWKQDCNGWWNSEGSSWSVGWKYIDGEWYYFDSNGYMKTGWIQYGDKWYYLYNSGAMAKNTTIDGYKVDFNGAWIKNTQGSSNQSNSVQNNESSLSNVNSNGTTISDVTGINLDDINKIVFYDGRGGINKPVTVENKQKIKEFMAYLDDYVIKKTKNPESTGWIQSAQFYVNDKIVMDITFVNPIIINGDYFNIIKGELDTQKIGEFIKSIDPSYDINAGLSISNNA